MGLWGSIKSAPGAIGNAAGRAWDWYDDASNRDKQDNLGSLNEQSGKAGGFADQSQSQFGKLGAALGGETEYLRKVARGEESVSAQQLRNSLQQNQAAQQSMAAGARPGNAAMAARTAAMTAGRQGAGLAGQQAVAGMQERQQAQQALTNALMQQRQQELSATQGARGQAIGGYGAGFTGAMGQPTGLEKGMELAGSVGSLLSLSDKRLKTNIADGSKDADSMLRSLKAYKYDYKDPRNGGGKQLGIMAQDLEKLGLKQAVVETPKGKAIHGGKLAGALAAMMPAVNKRLEELEGKK